MWNNNRSSQSRLVLCNLFLQPKKPLNVWSIEYSTCVLASPELLNKRWCFCCFVCMLFCITEEPFASMWSVWQQLSAGHDDFLCPDHIFLCKKQQVGSTSELTFIQPSILFLLPHVVQIQFGHCKIKMLCFDVYCLTIVRLTIVNYVLDQNKPKRIKRSIKSLAQHERFDS